MTIDNVQLSGITAREQHNGSDKNALKLIDDLSINFFENNLFKEI